MRCDSFLCRRRGRVTHPGYELHQGTACYSDSTAHRRTLERGRSASRRDGARLSDRIRRHTALARAPHDLVRQIRGERLPGMRSHGIQWLVHLLQELEEDGTIDHPICRKTVVPRGALLGSSGWMTSAHSLIMEADGDERRTAAGIRRCMTKPILNFNVR